jgi:hypothetical protein
MKPTQIFISYAHDEVARELPRLKYFVQHLRRQLNESFVVTVDYEHLLPGRDKLEYMRRHARECDVAIILLSPAYRKKVENRLDGVFTEWNILIERFQEHRDSNTYDRNFLLIPVTFIGNYADVSVPEISDLIALDLSRMYVGERQGKPFMAQTKEKAFTAVFGEIAQSINAIRTVASKDFHKNQSRLLGQFFEDTKARFDKPGNRTHIDHLFVRTRAYYDVRDETVRFILGRKGSGKSTITQVLPILESDLFSFEIPIYANEITLDPCYNVYSKAGRFQSDAQNVVPANDALAYIWDVFFHFSVAYQFLINNIGLWNQPTVKPVRKLIFRLLLWDLGSWNKDETPNVRDYNSLFLQSFERFQQYLSDSIDESLAHSDMYASEISQRLHIDRFREFVFTREGLTALYQCLPYIKKKVLVTFDGFDSAFALFRKDAIDYNRVDLAERAEFESKWLFSMVQLVIDNGIASSRNNSVYNKLHYCITIPFDRYVEIKERDRDSYRTRRDFSALRWSGLELSALIRKRLVEYALTYKKKLRDDEQLSLPDRLEKILVDGYPEMPREIEIERGVQKSKMSLFLYVLRHTFWRPRDILYYFATILAAFEVARKRDRIQRLDSGFVKQLVKQATRGLIKDEFIGEFRDVCQNFEEVIDLFDRARQVLSWEQFYHITKDVPFALIAGEDCSDEYSKVEFLYRIGFIGVIAPTSFRERDNLYKYSFSFNEDRVLTDVVKRHRYKECEFVIHPIFSEYLQLDLSDNPEIIFNFDWEYLADNEVRRGLGPK